jgi:hypothetical protein
MRRKLSWCKLLVEWKPKGLIVGKVEFYPSGDFVNFPGVTGLAKLAPGILNIGTTDVHALDSAESVAHIFDPKNLANVSGGRTNKLALTSCW